MKMSVKIGAAGAGMLAVVAICTLWAAGALAEPAATQASAALKADTTTVRLRISGMTCGSCSATARLALRKLDGVLSAEVSYDDSLGVVRYDRERVTPKEIIAHLLKFTGYRATVIPDLKKAAPVPRGG